MFDILSAVWSQAIAGATSVADWKVVSTNSRIPSSVISSPRDQIVRRHASPCVSHWWTWTLGYFFRENGGSKWPEHIQLNSKVEHVGNPSKCYTNLEVFLFREKHDQWSLKNWSQDVQNEKRFWRKSWNELSLWSFLLKTTSWCCWYHLFTCMVSKDISGDIRHPVDYLVELIETKVATECNVWWRHLKA